MECGEECRFNCDGKECKINPPTYNIMSYYSCSRTPTSKSFTPNQISRMHCFIDKMLSCRDECDTEGEIHCDCSINEENCNKIKRYICKKSEDGCLKLEYVTSCEKYFTCSDGKCIDSRVYKGSSITSCSYGIGTNNYLLLLLLLFFFIRKRDIFKFI